MTTIDPTLYLKNQTATRGVPSNVLGKDDFLKILMTQLQNQDPTNPMDDREFITQLAQFSSLEQVMNMSNAITSLVQNQNINPIIQYSHLIGKTVTYQPVDEETGKNLAIETSKVVAVSQFDGYAVLELENGEKVYADLILEVKDSELSQGTNETDGSIDDQSTEVTKDGSSENEPLAENTGSE